MATFESIEISDSQPELKITRRQVTLGKDLYLGPIKITYTDSVASETIPDILAYPFPSPCKFDTTVTLKVLGAQSAGYHDFITITDKYNLLEGTVISFSSHSTVEYTIVSYVYSKRGIEAKILLDGPLDSNIANNEAITVEDGESQNFYNMIPASIADGFHDNKVELIGGNFEFVKGGDIEDYHINARIFEADNVQQLRADTTAITSTSDTIIPVTEASAFNDQVLVFEGYLNEEYICNGYGAGKIVTTTVFSGNWGRDSSIFYGSTDIMTTTDTAFAHAIGDVDVYVNDDVTMMRTGTVTIDGNSYTMIDSEEYSPGKYKIILATGLLTAFQTPAEDVDYTSAISEVGVNITGASAVYTKDDLSNHPNLTRIIIGTSSEAVSKVISTNVAAENISLRTGLLRGYASGTEVYTVRELLMMKYSIFLPNTIANLTVDGYAPTGLASDDTTSDELGIILETSKEFTGETGTSRDIIDKSTLSAVNIVEFKFNTDRITTRTYNPETMSFNNMRSITHIFNDQIARQFNILDLNVHTMETADKDLLVAFFQRREIPVRYGINQNVTWTGLIINDSLTIVEDRTDSFSTTLSLLVIDEKLYAWAR